MEMRKYAVRKPNAARVPASPNMVSGLVKISSTTGMRHDIDDVNGDGHVRGLVVRVRPAEMLGEQIMCWAIG